MTFDFTDWTLVFDLDGTLVETAPDLHAALNYTLASKNLGPVPLAAIRAMVGDGAKALIRKGLSWHEQSIDEAEIDAALWATFLDHYRENITRLSHPYDGVVDTLTRLQMSKARLAVCTNKPQDLAEDVLRGLSLDHFFSAIAGSDSVASPKPDGAHIRDTIARASGNPAHAIMVGDSTTDEKAARNAGLPFVFITSGYGQLSRDPFPNLRSIDHWRDMETALRELARI